MFLIVNLLGEEFNLGRFSYISHNHLVLTFSLSSTLSTFFFLFSSSLLLFYFLSIFIFLTHSSCSFFYYFHSVSTISISTFSLFTSHLFPKSIALVSHFTNLDCLSHLSPCQFPLFSLSLTPQKPCLLDLSLIHI